MDSGPSWGPWRSHPRGVAGERGAGVIRDQKAIVKRRDFRSCTLVILFSETALEEPFTAAEGVYMGLDSETKEDRQSEREPAIMYTRTFCSLETVLEEPSWMSEG